MKRMNLNSLFFNETVKKNNYQASQVHIMMIGVVRLKEYTFHFIARSDISNGFERQKRTKIDLRGRVRLVGLSSSAALFHDSVTSI